MGRIWVGTVVNVLNETVPHRTFLIRANDVKDAENKYNNLGWSDRGQELMYLGPLVWETDIVESQRERWNRKNGRSI